VLGVILLIRQAMDSRLDKIRFRSVF